jgi:hypothetical protein
VVRAQDAFSDAKQGGVLVARFRGMSRVPCPAGQAAEGAQGIGVIRPVSVAFCEHVSDQPELVPRCRVAAAMPEGLGDLPHGGTGQVKDGPGMRQQQGARRPCRRHLHLHLPSLHPPRLWQRNPAGGHVRFAAMMLLLPAMNGQVSDAQLADALPPCPDKDRYQNYSWRQNHECTASVVADQKHCYLDAAYDRTGYTEPKHDT